MVMCLTLKNSHSDPSPTMNVTLATDWWERTPWGPVRALVSLAHGREHQRLVRVSRYKDESQAICHMRVMAFQITAIRMSKKTLKHSITGHLWGKSTGNPSETGGFPSERASNAFNVTMSYATMVSCLLDSSAFFSVTSDCHSLTS